MITFIVNGKRPRVHASPDPPLLWPRLPHEAHRRDAGGVDPHPGFGRGARRSGEAGRAAGGAGNAIFALTGKRIRLAADPTEGLERA
jgi:hypothetical protein